jgi:hypothetical protein
VLRPEIGCGRCDPERGSHGVQASPTKRKKDAFEAATKLQEPWVNGLAEGVSLKDIATTQA